MDTFCTFASRTCSCSNDSAIFTRVAVELFSKGANNEIDRTHDRVLRMFYEDYECSFEILLTRNGSVCIHVKNLQKLMIEIYIPGGRAKDFWVGGLERLLSLDRLVVLLITKVIYFLILRESKSKEMHLAFKEFYN